MSKRQRAELNSDFECGSKACKLIDFDGSDVDEEIFLKEEAMQVNVGPENTLLECKAVEKEGICRPEDNLRSKKGDLKKHEIDMLNQGQETSDGIMASLCDPRDHERRTDESEGTEDGERKKNEENIDVAPYARTTQSGESRSAKKVHEPRDYQLELAGPAIGGLNSIICVPTGSGETMTAALVCKRLAERRDAHADGPFKAVFVVCFRNLVSQQCDALHEFLPELKVGVQPEKQRLETVLMEKDIVVLAAQILVNALLKGEVTMKTLSLIVLDECHYASLDHPYNKLMQFYHQEKIKGTKPLPQILGMTASLGVGSSSDLKETKNHYIQICANLDCTGISHVRNPENRAELEVLNPKPSLNQIKMVDKRPEKRKFYLVMKKLMEDTENEYLQNGTLMQVPRGTLKYESTVSTLKQEVEKTMERSEEMVACEALLKMNSAWMIHDELRTKDALQLLNKYFNDNLKSKPGAVEKALCQSYNVARNDLESIEEQETLEDWPLLKALYDLLRQLYDEDCESRGIVMARTIQDVDGLLSFLEDYSPSVVTPKKLVGQRRNSEVSMTDVLLQFIKGEINLLVSTDVPLEGVDIPLCNFVIRFNVVNIEKGAAQAKGRIRARDSKRFVIAHSDSVNVEREMKNIKNERRMQDALDGFISSCYEDLQGLIKNRQEEMYKKLRMKMDADETRDGTNYSIHCKRCKEFLCSAEFIVRAPGHYICTDKDLTDRINVKIDAKIVGSYAHPESPKTGAEWMSEKVSFERLKITNNPPPVDGSTCIYLKTMKKYIPMVHIADVLNPSIFFRYSFPETSFIAVTAYQNTDITHLKIQFNKFAKGQKVELSLRHGSTGEEMNRSSDLSVLSSPEQQQHSFNFSSPVTSFNPLPSTPQFAYNPSWYSELSPPNSYMTNNAVYYQQPHWYTNNTGHHQQQYQPQQQYDSYTPPHSYMTNNAVSYQQPHWYTNNTGHHQQQYQPQQQYFHRESNSARSHPYRRSSEAVITNRVCCCSRCAHV